MPTEPQMKVEYAGAWYAIPAAWVANMRAAGLKVVPANEISVNIAEASRQRFAQLANSATKEQAR